MRVHVTCTLNIEGLIKEVATTVLVIVLDEDDNAPIAQINTYFWNLSKLNEVRCIFLVDWRNK